MIQRQMRPSLIDGETLYSSDRTSTPRIVAPRTVTLNTDEELIQDKPEMTANIVPSLDEVLKDMAGHESDIAKLNPAPVMQVTEISNPIIDRAVNREPEKPLFVTNEPEKTKVITESRKQSEVKREPDGSTGSPNRTKKDSDKTDIPVAITPNMPITQTVKPKGYIDRIVDQAYKIIYGNN